MQNIQSTIINYWQRKEKLPEKLSDLDDPISGFIAPIDSQTGASYEYNTKGDLEFELCAVFNRSWSSQQMGNTSVLAEKLYSFGYSQNWNHSQGRVCFERKIDKELYPPLKD